MNKIFLAFGVVLVVAGGIYFSARKDSSAPVVNPTASSTAETYRLIVIADTVTRKPAGGSAQVVQGETTVVAGDEITTSATGRARIRYPNGTLTTLEEDTTITIEELSDGGTKSRIELVVGDIWSRVTQVLGSGEHYEVQTQDTVAAVRGTLFRSTYRDRKARIQTLESKVRVSLRRSDGSVDESSATDVTEEMQAEFDGATVTRRLASRRITKEEMRDRVIERILRERNLEDADVRSSTTPLPSREVIPASSIKPSPTLSPSSSPRVSVAPSPSSSPRPSISPVPVVTSTPAQNTSSVASPTPTASPSPTPSLEVSLTGVTPPAINQGDQFVLEGFNFISGRNISNIADVVVGGQSAANFTIVDSQDIFVLPAQIGAGVFDVSVKTKAGSIFTLKGVLTIR